MKSVVPISFICCYYLKFLHFSPKIDQKKIQAEGHRAMHLSKWAHRVKNFENFFSQIEAPDPMGTYIKSFEVSSGPKSHYMT